MSDTKTIANQPKQHSERYTTIRKEAESKWPAWKVSTYNLNVAVSAHSKKVAK